jgi:hypothetical protein
VGALIACTLAIGLTLGWQARASAASPGAETASDLQHASTVDLALLSPPPGARPVVVRARFEFHDINEIDDGAETFEFSGVLTLEWRDPRVAFDPAQAGVSERVFLGGYQFDELATGWYPQLVLVNQGGSFEKHGTALRIRPDGTSTLIETVHAIAETELAMRLFPFDSHRLEAVFEVLGFDRDEVRLETEAGPGSVAADVRIPQWSVVGSQSFIRERPASHAGRSGVASAFVASVDVERRSFYMNRLVVIPMTLIALLSFTVFWMDRSSIADRLSVSFIGILTGVAYQLLVSDSMPRISYTTFIHAYLSLSFLFMCSTVVINLAVSSLDRSGRNALGDRVDRRCRWIFPLAYFAMGPTVFAFARML